MACKLKRIERMTSQQASFEKFNADRHFLTRQTLNPCTCSGYGECQIARAPL